MDDFLSEMRRYLGDAVLDEADAIFEAIQLVDAYPVGEAQRFFGPIGHGVFYCGEDYQTTRWFPDCSIDEALGRLNEEFGWDFTEGLFPLEFEWKD